MGHKAALTKKKKGSPRPKISKREKGRALQKKKTSGRETNVYLPCGVGAGERKKTGERL